MDFELSEEQRMIQDTAYKFAVNEFEPIAKECDREEKFPKELIKKAAEAGLVGCYIPEAYGGAGLGFLETALVTEQLCRVDLGLNLVVFTVTFGTENIMFFGTEAQKKKILAVSCKRSGHIGRRLYRAGCRDRRGRNPNQGREGRERICD